MSPYEPRPEGLNTQPAPPSVVETLKPRNWPKWSNEPPPHVGWWLTCNTRPPVAEGLWRWWNGKHWSAGIRKSMPSMVAARAANFPSLWLNSELVWTDYWPENARVPRVDPNEVKA